MDVTVMVLTQAESLTLHMGVGTLEPSAVPSRLDRGIYINNLWYLNYSDRLAGRITGMTFWLLLGRRRTASMSY